MQNASHRPLLLEQAACWCFDKLKKYKVPAIAGMIFGFLAYMFAFTNKLVNHDDVFTLFFKGGSFSLGRWGLEILELIFPNYSMPWIYGIITIALITLAACVIISIFSIENKLMQVLVTGSILVFPSLIGTFTYMFTSSSYAVSFLLAVLAVWFLIRLDKRSLPVALVCMIGSLSIYQSYVAVTASLLVLTLIQRLMKEEDILPIIRNGICYVLFLIISLGLYYAMTMVINKLRGVGFNGYANGSLSFSFAELPARILLAYRNFPRFFTGYRGLMPGIFSQLLHTLCLLLTGGMVFAWGISRKKLQFARLLWLLGLIALLPLAMNCMYLFTTEDAVHTLVLYGVSMIYVLAVVVADLCINLVPCSKASSLCVNAMGFVLALIVAANTYLANEAYLLLHLRYENAYAFYTSLIADIKMTPGFDEDTRLALIGSYQEPSFYLEKFPFSDHVTGTDGFLPDIYSKDRFLEYYLGFPIPFVPEEELSVIQNSAEVEQMPVYPYYGSMQLIDDVMVVKLS